MKRFGVLTLLLVGALPVSITLAVMLGPVAIEPLTVWRIALSHLPVLADWLVPWTQPDWTTAEANIVWYIRFPRVLLGAVVGAGLAVVGVAMQALVKNSLADPYILGISSGASVGATLVILFGAFSAFGQHALSAGAFIGALAAMLLVFLVSRLGGWISPPRLLLAGVAVSMMLSAATHMIIISAPDEEGVRSALFWIMGGLAGAKWDYLALPALVVTAGTVLLMSLARPLNVLLMGDETARTLGINTSRFHTFLLLFTALLTGVMVSVSGSIGFVGLMMPHIVRLAVGPDHRRVLPVGALLGAIFLIWADVLARLVWAPEELPVGVITALCGAPFFIWLLRRSPYSFGGS